MVSQENVGKRVKRTAEFEFQLDEDERGTTGRLRHVCAGLGYVEWSDGAANCIGIADIEVVQ